MFDFIITPLAKREHKRIEDEALTQNKLSSAVCELLKADTDVISAQDKINTLQNVLDSLNELKKANNTHTVNTIHGYSVEIKNDKFTIIP